MGFCYESAHVALHCCHVKLLCQHNVISIHSVTFHRVVTKDLCSAETIFGNECEKVIFSKSLGCQLHITKNHRKLLKDNT